MPRAHAEQAIIALGGLMLLASCGRSTRGSTGGDDASGGGGADASGGDSGATTGGRGGTAPSGGSRSSGGRGGVAGDAGGGKTGGAAGESTAGAAGEDTSSDWSEAYFAGESGVLYRAVGTMVEQVAAAPASVYGAWLDSRDSIWLVTDAGHVYHVAPGGGSVAFQLPSGKSLAGVFGIGTDLWAVGSDPVAAPAPIARHDGGVWSEELVMEVRWLADVWASDVMDVWAVGERLFHDDGSGWSVVDGPSGEAIWGSGPDDVWVGGSSGIFRWRGESWLTVEGAPENSIRDIWGRNDSDVWVASDRGVHRYDGSSFTPVRDAASGGCDIKRIMGGSGGDLWAVGSSSGAVAVETASPPEPLVGCVEHWDGRAWEPVSIPGDVAPFWAIQVL